MSRKTRPLQMLDAMGHVIPYNTDDSKYNIIYSTDTVRYHGVARPGAEDDAAAWRVSREIINASGNTTGVTFAEGNNEFNSVWDDSTALVSNAATAANPCEITTTTDHGFITGDIINIEDVVGMTELNDNYYTITRVDATKFTLGVDSTLYTAYTSGGKCYKRTFANYSFS